MEGEEVMVICMAMVLLSCRHRGLFGVKVCGVYDTQIVLLETDGLFIMFIDYKMI